MPLYSHGAQHQRRLSSGRSVSGGSSEAGSYLEQQQYDAAEDVEHNAEAMQIEGQKMQAEAMQSQAEMQLQAQKLQIEQQLEQMKQDREDARKSAELNARMTMNAQDNQTAMQLAQAEIMSGERIAVSTGTGINPNP